MRARLLCVLPLLIMVACGAEPPTPPAAGSDGRSVWDQYRAAAGGDALGQMRGLRANAIAVNPGASTNQRLVIEAAAPANYRQRESSEDRSARGLRQLVGYNGTIGWRAGNTLLGGDGLSADEAVRERAITAASRQNYINFVAGVMPTWLQESGLTLVDSGPAAVTISHDGIELGTLTFDGATGLPQRLVVPFLKAVRPEGGEYQITFEDYRNVGQGVKLPYRITRKQGDLTVHWSIRGYQGNPTFPAGTFEPPRTR